MARIINKGCKVGGETGITLAMESVVMGNGSILVLIPVALAMAHWLGLYGHRHLAWCLDYLRSFTSGFSVGYVFLLLIPELPNIGESLGQNAPVYMLMGFVFFHIVHRYIFRTKKRKLKALLLDEIHLVAGAGYSFLVAFTLVELAKISVFKGMILAMIILVHTLLSDISKIDAEDSIVDKIKMPVLVVLTLLGGWLSILNFADKMTSAVLFAISAGAVSYMAIREEIPTESKGKPALFLMGVVVILGVDKVLLLN